MANDNDDNIEEKTREEYTTTNKNKELFVIRATKVNMEPASQPASHHTLQ